MATPSKGVDRRVQRTRQLLQQAFLDIMQEKGFTAMNIQEITERANLNRGTFYAHFADKYALLEEILHEQFRSLIEGMFPPAPQWNRHILYALIQAVLEYFKSMYHNCSPFDIIDPLLKHAVQEELYRFFLNWLKYHRARERQIEVRVETLAGFMSWSIFGAALQWSQENDSASSEQIAREVLLVITEGIAQFVPTAFTT
ncbi:TetR/AcrR family transcriptional regulator [Ktedonosporobacter rubrisoli]|uniref:TetR/AcrR family transcriptional regulator n=1 Tax=Ktedonosporobacter rubrisoli TaxID=2509675 RepID=UPI0013EEAF47|nr:TetR/AcrR family transcriptional regulator [Ktedonosporobacter rubrisoli]